MVEGLIHFHDTLWPPLKWLFDFLLGTIVLRGIIGNEILSEIRQKGWLKEGILHRMINKITHVNSIARKVAIVQHFRHGHEHDSVIGCNEGNCMVFDEPVGVTRPLAA